ncbi:MAG: penicillin-binding protein 1C [Alphaproteobacteria bacterium]|nr:penicillin-binding protein 1C [Alphaproteobacteria bacterium]
MRLFIVPPLLGDVHFSRAYYDRNGTLMRLTLSADEKYRTFTPLNEISPTLRRATILYEDKYFYYHFGINPIAIIRATMAYMRGQPHPAGASTITMQVARIKYNLNTKTIGGKLKQIAIAIYIDAFYSKSEILTAYLNLAPYGGNIEGIGAAALVYFHKPAADLSMIQAITLATIPQNPTKRGLNTESGLKYITRMRSDLVRRWIAANPADKNIETFANMELARFGVGDLPFMAPHFINRELSRTNYWATRGENQSHVQTTLNMELQNKLTHRIRTEIARRRESGIKNAAAILVNYKTREIISYIGSAEYFNPEIFGENDGVNARRSPGSTLKPLIYAYAADLGLIHGMTLMRDARVNFGVYAPENSDNEFYGPVLARDALTHSRNIPAINLVRQIGVANFHKLLTDCGVANLMPPEHYGISIALGGADISMRDIATIYTTMANLGEYGELQTRIPHHEIKTTHLLSPEAFFITLDMLGHAAAPTKNIMFSANNPPPIKHYWKTGTSSSYRDAWTAGIFGDFVLVVWVGNFDGRPNNAFSGARTAAPIYFALADTVAEYMASQGTPVHDNNFLRDNMNIATVQMCDGVGGIAGPYCPHVVDAYFIPGKSPIDTSPIYRAVKTDRETGRRACGNDTSRPTDMRVYEFWDAEFLDMFRRAGIRRNTPPPFMPGCDLNTIAMNANPPVIISPRADTKTVILGENDTAQISFRAVTESPYATIFWFMDNEIIGETKSGTEITRDVKMGPHTIRAVDTNGTATTVDFSIVR